MFSNLAIADAFVTFILFYKLAYNTILNVTHLSKVLYKG